MQTPVPPFLVIDEERSAFWIETEPPSDTSVTRWEFETECFLDCVCYDASGMLWPIVAVRPKSPLTAERRWFWRRVSTVTVELEFGTPTPVGVPGVVSRLAEVLLWSNFSAHAQEDPANVVRWLEEARTPERLIEEVRQYLPRVRPFGRGRGAY